MRMVEVKAVSFRYPGRTAKVLETVDFNLERGQIAVITGPSGSGKSTLGYCICGVIPNLIQGEFSGEVNVLGKTGIVFQDPDTQIFLPAIEDELAFGPENLCLAREEIGERIQHTLDLIGLSHLRLENPAKLSGGQKQLIALGGVLTLDPDIFVLDETMAQLDLTAQAAVRQVLEKLRKQGKSIIMIEHKKSFWEMADQIWVLQEGKLSKIREAGAVKGNE